MSKLVNGAFAPRAMQRLEARVREIAAERVEALVHQARFDMLPGFLEEVLRFDAPATM